MKTLQQLAAALALAATPFMAFAQGFVEFSIGRIEHDLGDTSGFSADDSDTTWAISGGYMFHPNVGAEIGYRDAGEASLSGVDSGVLVRVEAEISGVFGGLVGRVPVSERFALAGRLGMFMWEADIRGFGNGILVLRDEEDGTDPYFGFGASYAISRQIEVGLAWTRFDIDGDDSDALELKTRFSF